MLQKKIDSISFKVLDPKTIRAMSAIQVKTDETYDKDGYPMEEGLMDPHLGVINPGIKCKTCGQTMKYCPGHFGSLELVRPVVHAKFSKQVDEFLNATCRECGKIVLPPEKLAVIKLKLENKEIEVNAIAKKIKTMTAKIKRCPYCQALKAKVKLDKPTNFSIDKERLYPNEIRAWLEKIPDEHVKLFGINPEHLRPEWLVLTVLPIPPITIRPSITLESGIKSEDDLTHKLVDIIRINQRLKENIEAGAPQLIIEDLWDLLQYHATTYFDNQIAGVPPAKHRSGRPLRTIVQRLKGKKGRFRYNLTGKRVNYAARTTICADPYLSINEVGVPEEIAKELTVPERVTEWNKKKYKNMIKNTDLVVSIVRPDGRRKIVSEDNKKEIAEEIDVGYIIERSLINGDIVLFNRQPSLHRLSMLGHYVRIHKDKTFKLNPIVCKPYNADFDGDEMNLHAPQTEEGKAEARELTLVQNHVLSPRYGAPIITLDEDGISGTFVLTMHQTEFTKEEAFKYFYEMELQEIPAPDRGNKYSGKLIFSQLLPKDLNLEYESKLGKTLRKIDPKGEVFKEELKFDAHVKIVNGTLVSGVIDDESLGEGKGKLVDILAKNYEPKVLERFYYHLNRIVGDLLLKKGMTVGLDEYYISERIEKHKEKEIAEYLKKSADIVKKYENKTLELIPGRNLDDSFEIQMIRLGMETKEKIQAELLKEKLGKVLRKKPILNSAIMIVSGSRGSAINLMNISGFWGQASVREGRPKHGFKNRVHALNKKGDVSALAGGFITTNFMQGMNPVEYFYHAIGGRQGEVDTGVSTKVSGYLYRRLANSLKDLSVKENLSVKSGDGKIVQFSYGEDGVFPMKSFRGKAINLDFLLHKFKKDKEKGE